MHCQKLFYTIAYEGTFHISAPVVCQVFKSQFDESFKIVFDESEQIVIKVLGISDLAEEKLISTLKYHV